jgi:hypothetical protein
MNQRLGFEVVHGDIRAFRADVIGLKYTQHLYGADATVAALLGLSETALAEKLFKVGKYCLVDGAEGIAAAKVLFVGVVPLNRFRYAEIREFAERVLIALVQAAPQTQHLAVTMHGATYGLNELEAFGSQLAGFLDGQAAGKCPAALARISFVEVNAKRAARMRGALGELLPAEPAISRGPVPPSPVAQDIPLSLGTVGRNSEAKPHVFVAMPFDPEFDDTYYYGIEPVVQKAGFLCERADTRSFAGDILEWLKQRIETAHFVIADLTNSNPNVYLEVGYAWGHARPTVLLTKDPQHLRFDVKTQRCVLYKSIRELEERLQREIASLQIPTARSVQGP